MGHVRRLPIAAALGALTLLGCTSGEAPPTADPTDVRDLREGRDWGDRVVDEETGHLVKEEGQWGGIDMQDDVGVAFRVVEISEDLECTVEEPPTPENDQFIGLEIEIETNPHMDELGQAQMPIGAENFQVRMADGGITGGLLGAGGDCLPEDELLAPDINPGEHVTGMVVLDAPSDVEAIVLDGNRYEMPTGWIWPVDGTAR